jgi:uncharacterized damage-inducible protein DinB
MLTQLQRLLDHLAWANRRTLATLRQADDDEGRRYLAHLLASEKVWLTRIRTGDSSDLEIWPELTLDGCEDLMQENLDAYGALLAEISERELSGKVTYENSRGVEFHTPLVEILLHVFMHGSYHRGQIARRAREAGGEPVNTDVITFVRERPSDGGPAA